MGLAIGKLVWGRTKEVVDPFQRAIDAFVEGKFDETATHQIAHVRRVLDTYLQAVGAPAGKPVRVLDGSGQGCTLAHQPGAWLADYLAACGSQGASRPLSASPRRCRRWGHGQRPARGCRPTER